MTPVFVLLEKVNRESIAMVRYVGKKFDTMVHLKYEDLSTEWPLSAVVEDFRKNGVQEQA